MIEYILIIGLIPVVGFIGWLVGYGMGFKDYTKHKEFIEGTK